MASNGTPQGYLYSRRPVNHTRDRSAEQQTTNSGNPNGYVPQYNNQQQQGQGSVQGGPSGQYNGGYQGNSGSYVPQNNGNVAQPNAYNPQFQSSVQNRYQPPTMTDPDRQTWGNNGLSYQLPAGYGPYNNNGYQVPYFNQSQGANNGNPYGGSPATQQQQQQPFSPQFNPSSLPPLPGLGAVSTGIAPSSVGTGNNGGQVQQMGGGQQQASPAMPYSSNLPVSGNTFQQSQQSYLPQLANSIQNIQSSQPGNLGQLTSANPVSNVQQQSGMGVGGNATGPVSPYFQYGGTGQNSVQPYNYMPVLTR